MLYEALGSKSEYEKRSLMMKLSIDSYESDYTISLMQQYFEIENSVSYQELRAQQKSSAEDIRFAELNKNPDSYIGQFVKYKGKIIQIMEDGSSGMIRLAVTKDSYGYDYDDVVYVTYEGTVPFVEDDIATVYGTIMGSSSI